MTCEYMKHTVCYVLTLELFEIWIQLTVMFSILLFSGFCLLPFCLPRQYHFVRESRSWAEAQSFCRFTYTDLATVDNMTDMSRLLESVDGTYNGSAWIGLYDDPKNSWRWSLEGPQFYKEGEKDFRNWVTTLADVSRREPVCVIFDRGIWHLYPCETLLSFVCFDGRENATESLVLISEFKNWTEAQRYCREHHTDLASIRNQKENGRIASIVGLKVQLSFVWIGLYRTRIWSDQSNSSFRYWKAEEPNVNLEHLSPSCATVSFGDSGRWIEESCNITLPFICHMASPVSPRQYHFVRESKSWAEAQSYCRNIYTDLATVDNMRDMSRLLGSVNGTYGGSAWIGLYDDPKNSWKWSLEDPQFYKEGEKDFRRWFEYPLNERGNDFCALMLFNTQPTYEERWVDRSCMEERQFICYKESNNTTGTYVPIAESKTWMDAQSYCREHYVDLASVRNQEENLEIFTETRRSFEIQFLDGVWGVWIGLYRTRTWSDNSNSSFTYWRKGEPDDGKNSMFENLDQHCTAVSLNDYGQWTDENCLTALPFVCYSCKS
ncbi:C-type mannose receptor 2-like [Colossoma macropomum]|uniref:C-type mannose receptor 2-like n=1 Tax=Colossoma macropomum TaxID=42526 RepID=UPI001864CC3D|nr:C-type mannose receptor 2-like [Colossoma macropomum]